MNVISQVSVPFNFHFKSSYSAKNGTSEKEIKSFEKMSRKLSGDFHEND